MLNPRWTMTEHYRLNGMLLRGSGFAGTRTLTAVAGYKMENEWSREILAVVISLRREILCPRAFPIIGNRRHVSHIKRNNFY